jgi:hypothetical protein
MLLSSYHVWICGYICVIISDLCVIDLISIVTTEINTSVQARTHTHTKKLTIFLQCVISTRHRIRLSVNTEFSYCNILPFRTLRLISNNKLCI